jgi:cell wall-associated NlpC family hydrolase
MRKTALKSLLFIIHFLTINLCFAQKNNELSLEVENYMCDKNIELDSCSYTNLYNEIYKWIDTPYKYAGTTINGVDCSGLIKNIYDRIYNISLNGGSSSIFTEVIVIENKNDLKEGDLVFFKIKKNRISHIGIYLKDNYFVHSSTKKGVIISSLNEDYYQKYYFSGGRIP